MTMQRTVRDILFEGEDIYAGFPLDDHPPDQHTWGGRKPIFGQIIAAARPSFIIEVGTWLGASAITMAHACREHGVDCREIVCVDTWLGSDRMILHGAGATIRASPHAHRLRRRHGFPRMYDVFLANVLHEGCEDLITPLAATSDAGASLLTAIGLSADLIYIDADHRYEAVSVDLRAYWPLLAPGGVLMAHDYTDRHPGCRRAIDEFSDQLGLQRYPVDGWCFLVK